MKRGPKPKFTETESWCPDCKALRPRSEFDVRTFSASGVQGYCREHHHARKAPWQAKRTAKGTQRKIISRQASITRLQAEIAELEIKLKHQEELASRDSL